MTVLYIVLHHRNNPHNKWKDNQWLDDDRVASITTTPEVAEQCKQQGIAYVHRCGWKERRIKPTISCSAMVKSVSGSPDSPIVHFKDTKAIRKPVKRRLFGPTNSYYDVAP
jgi:hypothetical protein